MRRDGSHLFPLISIFFLFSVLSYGQSWSGILSTSRAIDWTGAGLQSIFPDGETAPNPWTPPTRTLCTTVSTLTNIVSVMSGCSAGTYVLLSAGTYTLSSALNIYGANNVTLRGAGPMSTTISMTGGAEISLGAASGAASATLTSAPGNYTVGTTSVVVTTSSPPSVGTLVWFNQCDTGFNGSPCTGTATDNGGLFICSFYTACDLSGGTPNTNESQQQNAVVTSVTNSGGGTYTIGFTPGIYMLNWAYAQSATLNWQTQSYVAVGVGLEDMTITYQAGQNQYVALNSAYDSWVKGLRVIGGAVNAPISLNRTVHCLAFNNYIYAETPTSIGNANQLTLDQGSDSTDLILNNIMTGGLAMEGEGLDTGVVIAYNYNRDSQTTYYQNSSFQHHGEASFILHEGNEFGISEADDTWGTHHLDTWFRNYFSGWDSPYVTVNPRSLEIDNYARFENIIGNALGGSKSTAYQGTSSSVGNIYVIPTSDTVAMNSMMRWGNCDTVTGTCRFDSSEVPTSLSGNAAPFVNSVPSSQNLPCSFFLAGYTSTTCTPHPNGGTGLSWWKVCTNWTTFPTSCSATQTQPFPVAGPDVTGGAYVNGTAYDVPAAVAFNNLPIDTSYQQSYSITGSSWSSGTETLTVSGLPNVAHLMGGFQVIGVSACNSGAGAEFVMTGSTSTTVSYALASNPGNCAGGTMKFPDVRQFDERVYQNDPGGNPPQAPTGLTAAVQ